MSKQNVVGVRAIRKCACHESLPGQFESFSSATTLGDFLNFRNDVIIATQLMTNIGNVDGKGFAGFMG